MPTLPELADKYAVAASMSLTQPSLSRAKANNEARAELVAGIAALQAERDEYQQAADKMAWEHKVERDALQVEIAALRAALGAAKP